LPIVSVQDCQVPGMDRRMDVRKMASFNTIVADKVGLARGPVTNISRRGCGLCLTKLLRPNQYITLKVYLDEGPAIQIDLGKVQWVEEERAGVEFLYLSHLHTLALYRLCAEQVELPLGT
jgi:hypothetical protein